MSFTVYVPCNCRKQGKLNIPSFMNKLAVNQEIFEDGILYPKPEFRWDEKFKKDYYRWSFCEHNNQKVIEFSMAGMLGWRTWISEKYDNQFENFVKFLPLSNQWKSSNYSKVKVIEEIKTFNQLENGQYQYRVNQFIALLEKAIEMDEEIYWD